MEIEQSKTETALRSNNDELQLPWVEKYRPKRLEDLVAHEDIISILTKLIESDNLPHLLLYGPPGTGKTSTITAAAKKMYGEKLYSAMALELNASDARGIDVVRNQIKEFAGTRQLFSKGIKLIILDEADSMTNDAQNALRRIIEKHTKNARFCLICNYVSKIIPALQSRCTRFRFAPLSRDQIYGRLTEVAKAESVDYTEDGLEAILSLSGGDMRRVLNLLQSTAMSFQNVNDANVYLTSGAPLPSDLEKISYSLFNHEFATAQETIATLCKIKGYALVDIIADLTTVVTNMELPSGVLAFLLDGMSSVEYRLAFGTDEEIQCASLVGVFIKSRLMMKVQ
mmetsp:Transcript_17458/g.21313  ORF Transcript_17458/g.21313 Transcript_17458/m.21313 type:complete len:341 (+) Transcript_17458:56-1078(+)